MFTVLLLANHVVWMAGHVGQAVGGDGTRGAEPRQGRHSAEEIPYVAPGGASEAGNRLSPSAVALGHIMAALTGLAAWTRYAIVFVESGTKVESAVVRFSRKSAPR